MDTINLISAYESGELENKNILKLFSKIIKNGQAWILQGHYGRTASSLIEAGYINSKGKILKTV